jgi:N-acetylglucosaminylphosphatidylinositol deacetylase
MFLFLSVFSLLSILLYAYHSLAYLQHSPPQLGRHVLILTAHPDDECMFFGPTITSLVRAKTRVHVLCLSTGIDGIVAFMICCLYFQLRKCRWFGSCT